MENDSGVPNILEQWLSPIAPFLCDPNITDILIYGSDSVHVRERGKDFEHQKGVSWETDADLMSMAKTIGREMGRRLDEREPILDARLPDRSRVNIVTAPCYDRGACIVIRKFPEQHFTLADLERFGAIDSNGQKILEVIMKYGRNVLIAGGTGSGKTTLLNSLCGFIPKRKIVVTVEDAREISISCDLWVSFETKRAIIAIPLYISNIAIMFKPVGNIRRGKTIKSRFHGKYQVIESIGF
jgi:pilus assembly protein CpaF